MKEKTKVLAQAIATFRNLGQNCGSLTDKDFQVIELQNVSYGYGDGDLFTDLSLKLAPGSFHFLTGPSGAGKTTFLKLCYMQLRATSGHVQIFGKDVSTMSRDDIANNRSRIGVVHQDCKFLDHLPLTDNVTLPLSVTGREVNIEDMNDLLHWVGLETRKDRLPPELSGGERQRAALARAVIMSPEVILADEPTGNVDWEMSQRLLSLLIELNKMGKTIMIATHDLNLIRTAKSQVNTRVLRLADGKLQLAGSDL